MNVFFLWQKQLPTNQLCNQRRSKILSLFWTVSSYLMKRTLDFFRREKFTMWKKPLMWDSFFIWKRQTDTHDHCKKLSNCRSFSVCFLMYLTGKSNCFFLMGKRSSIVRESFPHDESWNGNPFGKQKLLMRLPFSFREKYLPSRQAGDSSK